jgi:hypothetical protein
MLGNKYAYMNGNPLSGTDPLGLWEYGDSLPDWMTPSQDLVDFSAGFGDDLSFGITKVARKWLGSSFAVNKCSKAYSVGKWSGVALGLAFAGAHAGPAIVNQSGAAGDLALGLRRFFVDNRTWNSIQRMWSKSVGGYLGGYELHHWFMPRSMGGSNAGWNYLPTSPWLNNMMSDGGKMYNLFRASVVGVYGSAPTAAFESAFDDCTCGA